MLLLGAFYRPQGKDHYPRCIVPAYLPIPPLLLIPYPSPYTSPSSHSPPFPLDMRIGYLTWILRASDRDILLRFRYGYLRPVNRMCPEFGHMRFTGHRCPWTHVIY